MTPIICLLFFLRPTSGPKIKEVVQSLYLIGFINKLKQNKKNRYCKKKKSVKGYCEKERHEMGGKWEMNEIHTRNRKKKREKKEEGKREGGREG